MVFSETGQSRDGGDLQAEEAFFLDGDNMQLPAKKQNFIRKRLFSFLLDKLCISWALDLAPPQPSWTIGFGVRQNASCFV